MGKYFLLHKLPNTLTHETFLQLTPERRQNRPSVSFFTSLEIVAISASINYVAEATINSNHAPLSADPSPPPPLVSPHTHAVQFHEG